MALDSILNFAIPALLIVIAFGFVYVKFIGPYVVPWLVQLWEWLKGKETTTTSGKKEIIYE